MFTFIYLICLGVLFACITVYYMHDCCLWRPEENIISPRTVVTEGYELPCLFRELNWGPLEKESVFLITDPFL